MIVLVKRAGHCIRGLMKLAILRDGIGDIQEQAARLIMDYGWGNADQRKKAAEKIHG